VERLNKEINAAFNDAAMKARFSAIAGELMPGSPQEFGKTDVRRDRKVGEGREIRRVEIGVRWRADRSTGHGGRRLERAMR
jgi:hypothetical protein